MSKLTSYEDIRDYINGEEGNGCKLITTKEEFYEIKGTPIKKSLLILCGCKINEFTSTFDIFKHRNKKQCNLCIKKKMSNLFSTPFEEINKYINDMETGNGCVILTTKIEFEEEKVKQNISNSNVKLRIRCRCGNIFYSHFNMFKSANKKQCNDCSSEKRKINNTKSYEDIKKVIENLGYFLVSDTYVNGDFKLIIKDTEGYFYSSLVDSLLHNHSPYFVHAGNPYTIQNIKLWCKIHHKPFDIVSIEYENSSSFLYWKCLKKDCGEIFKSKWSDISSGNGCGCCAGFQVGYSNCLATKRPDIAGEWHPTLNGKLTPNDVTSCSNKEAWWLCSNVKCNYEWNSIISNRTGCNANGCPKCNKSKGEKRIEKYFKENNFTESIDYIPQKPFPKLIGVGYRQLSYDFYLPQYNLLIEYQGEFHDGTAHIQTEDDFKRQQEHDKRKKQYALDNNINLLPIWYWDFENIEKILDKELN